jgi:hypothetical protein
MFSSPVFQAYICKDEVCTVMLFFLYWENVFLRRHVYSEVQVVTGIIILIIFYIILSTAYGTVYNIYFSGYVDGEGI